MPAERDGELADLLDQLVSLGAFLLADHVAKDAAQQADVFDEGAFVVFGSDGGSGHGVCVVVSK